MPEVRAEPLRPLASHRPDETSAAPEVGVAILVSAAIGALLLPGSPDLRGGSLLGISLGALGLLLMLAGALGYAWRKRHSGPGRLQVWLQAHVVSGLVGPVLISLHSGLAFRGFAGLTFLVMLLVATSGAVGRYVHPVAPAAHVPHAAWWVLHVPVAYAFLLLALSHAAVAAYLTLMP